jgi:hypothetical protein
MAGPVFQEQVVLEGIPATAAWKAAVPVAAVALVGRAVSMSLPFIITMVAAGPEEALAYWVKARTDQ